MQHLTNDGNLKSLTEAVILQHSALAGLSQGRAEEYYILAAQLLDGYGQETFEAKVSTMKYIQNYFYPYCDITFSK